MSKLKLIGGAIVLLIASVITLTLFEIRTVEGNQLGVKETWGSGVENVVLQPKTYFLFPGYSQKIYTYDAASQVYTLENYKVQSQEGQDLTIDAVLQWRRDPSKLVFQHKTIRDNIEQKIINPVMLRIIKDEATARKAIDAYAGEGLVALQTDIQQTLASKEGELAEKGVFVENFVIRHIDLDPNYITEIKARQVATQKQLRSVEEEKAATAQALVAKALAQADLNKSVVEAERDKQVQVLKAEALNEQTILQAKAENEKSILAAMAEKEKRILEADGEKQAQIAKAQGVEAMGRAEALAQELKLKAYAVQGSEAYTRIEVSKNLAQAFQGVKGYIPADLKINVLADSFDKAVDSATGNVIVPLPKQ